MPIFKGLGKMPFGLQTVGGRYNDILFLLSCAKFLAELFKMRVLILTEAGKKIGFGHIARCMALYQGFEEKSLRPKIVINGDETIKDLLKGIDCSIFNWVGEKEKIFNIIDGSAIIVVDSYLADFGLYKEISEKVKVPVYIDDNQRLDYPRGIVVNGAIYSEELEYPQKEDVSYLLGSKYIPLRREFWDVPQKEIKEKIREVMITFGGDDARGMTYRILNLLNESHPTLTKKVIIGRGFKNIEKIERLKDKRTELIYYPDGKDMKEAMLEADIAISGGGQTLYELARIGVPTVVIAVAENQLNNIKGFQKAGFIEYAGWWKDSKILKKALMCFENLKDRNIRLKISSSAKRFVDGKGSRRIIRKLLEKYVKQ